MRSCHCPTCGRATTLYALRDVPQNRADWYYRKRIRNLVAQFQLEGYTTRDRDLEVCVAAAQIMAKEGESDHMHAILDRHAERLIAGSMVNA